MPARLSRCVQPGRHACRMAASRASTDLPHNTMTNGYICAKVRRFTERVYGSDRLMYPAIRKGPKGHGTLRASVVGRCAWRSSRRSWKRRASPGAASRSCPIPTAARTACSRRTRRRHAVPPARRIAARSHGVRGADRRCQRGALRQDAVGHLRGLPRRSPHHHVGRQPVSVWHPPGPLHPRGAAQRRRAHRHRSADHGARQAGRHPSGDQTRHRSAGGPGDPPLPLRGGPCRSGVSRRPHAVTPSSCARRRCRGRSSARPRKPASPPGRSRPSRSGTRKPRRRSIRCGWGQERNRNGGNSSLAILALPAVAGKFGVRGGGYAMSNTAAWGIERTWIGAQEPATRLVNMNQLGRALTEYSIRRSASCSSTTRTRR